MPVVVTIEANETKSSFDNPCAVLVTKSPASVNVHAVAVDNGEPVPATVMPTVKLDVLVCVIVVEPTVVPHAVLETAGLADAANDAEIVKVAAAVLTADRTRSIADFDSFVLVKSVLTFNSVKSALIKLKQL